MGAFSVWNRGEVSSILTCLTNRGNMSQKKKKKCKVTKKVVQCPVCDHILTIVGGKVTKAEI